MSRIFLLLFCSLVMVLSPIAAQAESRQDTGNAKPLVVGIFPRFDVQKTLAAYLPLIRFLEKSLDQPTRLEVSANFDEFEQKLERGQFDLLHSNQYQYIRAHENLGYAAIAQNEEFGIKKLRAAIYAPSDANITTLQDLRGKTIAFGGNRNALISYILPTYLMRQAGLRAGDYRETFVDTPVSALLAMFVGHADATGAGDIILKLPSVKKMLARDQVKVIAFSEPVSHLPWAVGPAIPRDKKAQIRSLLLGLENTEAGRQVLKAANLTRLNKATDADYDQIRYMLKTILPEKK